MCDLTPEHVLAELAEIAFADPEAANAPPVKTADKLRALEMLYKHLGLGDGAKDESGRKSLRRGGDHCGRRIRQYRTILSADTAGIVRCCHKGERQCRYA